MPNSVGQLYRWMSGCATLSQSSREECILPTSCTCTCTCSCRVGLSPSHTKLKERDKRHSWFHYRAAVRLSNQLSRCSTAGGTQHVLHWYTVDSAPNTLLTNLKSPSLETAKKDLHLYVCCRCYTRGHYKTTHQGL